MSNKTKTESKNRIRGMALQDPTWNSFCDHRAPTGTSVDVFLRALLGGWAALPAEARATLVATAARANSEYHPDTTPETKGATNDREPETPLES
jgi:hypothetical protein